MTVRSNFEAVANQLSTDRRCTCCDLSSKLEWGLALVGRPHLLCLDTLLVAHIICLCVTVRHNQINGLWADLVEFVGVAQHDDDLCALFIHHLPEVYDRRHQGVLGGDHLGTRRNQILGPTTLDSMRTNTHKQGKEWLARYHRTLNL